MAYATVEQVEAGFRTLTTEERTQCEALLDEAVMIIDAYNAEVLISAAQVVSCRMVRRAIGAGSGASVPMGATQGSMTAGPYSQSWTIGSGAAGELYLSRLDKKLLGVGERIGSYSPVENMVSCND